MFRWLKKKKTVPKNIKTKKEFLAYIHDEENARILAKKIDKFMLKFKNMDRAGVILTLSILTGNIKALSDKYDTISKSKMEFFNSIWHWSLEAQQIDLTKYEEEGGVKRSYIG